MHADHIDDVLKETRPVAHTVDVCVRGDLLAEISQLRARLADVREDDRRLNRQPQAPALQERIQELQRQARDHSVTFRFQAIGNRAWSDLLKDHPPTTAQQKEALQAGDPLQFNPETFPKAAIAASCTQPEGMTLAKVQELWERWNFDQCQKLWGACLAANVGSTDVPFTDGGSNGRRDSAPSSTTAPREESPAASS